MGALRDATSAGGILDPGGLWDAFSGKAGARAAEGGAQLQYDATLKGIEEQRQGRIERRGDLAPFTWLGRTQIDPLTKLVREPYEFNPQNDPALQFINKTTMDQVQNSAAAKGKFNSGGTLAELADRIAGNTAQYTSEQRRLGLGERNNTYNELYNLVTLGQNSAAGQGAATQDSTNAITALLGQGGNALAAGGVGAANSYAQGAQNMAGLAGLAAAFFSDERMKENIEPLYVDNDGLTVYKFNYIGDSDMYVGKMAQEIAEIDPAHVAMNDDGYLMVTAKYAPVRVA